MDLDAAVAFDAEGLLTQLENSSTSNETEGWVQGVDTSLIETELSNYQTQLESYLNVNAPTATLGDVLGLQTINPSVANTLESAAPTYSVGLNTTVDLLPEDLFYRYIECFVMNIYASQLICALIMLSIVGFSIYEKIDYKILFYFGVVFLSFLCVVYLVINLIFDSDCSIKTILSFNRVGCSPVLFTIAFSLILAAVNGCLLRKFKD